ncbi:DNA mismatch repair protein MutS [Candidatus Kinetoplastibacterium blastocrithidii TCC012E]|uniref:DNA mismatch repair protein MutS n=2 Tax=cellular organisms TaxID=131567 RepID=S9V9G0_9TRYP|nr:DNA mismatch repair protein MutS [Candidatus Kinetoplastibacterium blastocrithidii]AFZ83501.1 DNA mismatch repair protein MutS [Candidatus Kinetoplastibacterium blastocrithidii (ex Strigomonas culicis)]AGF49598.1 DNA mismatch repair protein MutS [Candidatus Kinetoplastibacterium blastocrithidii TCC012E]EPY18867.1 DNA mismatch repair protein MutS [Strigomonas culicis]EPY23601.1 DNA mismatch repair protein MutS [Strigomonas culicis]|eukprot:EPY18867.1 DNA mismatch repair protein MutS [Strigomonas culicis]
MEILSDYKTPNSMDGLTPLMKQYLTLKKEAGSMLLLFRLGDFYELFYDDAEKASHLLNLTLTRRGSANGIPIPMAGIPANSLEQYLSRLLEHGESIAISEQINENSSSIKNTLVERKIVRVITPGTIIEDTLLPSKSDRALVAINTTRNGKTGIAYLNLANGDFKIVANSTEENINSELHRLSPAEIIFSESSSMHTNNYDFITRYTPLPEWHFEYENATRYLLAHLKVESLSSFGLNSDHLGIGAAGALIRYANRSQSKELSHIQNIYVERNDQLVFLDSTTRKNLEINKTINGENSPTLFSILDKCCTQMGSRLLKQWLNNPTQNNDSVLLRQSAISALIQTSLHKKNSGINTLDLIKSKLKQLPDMERMLSRIALKYIRPREIANLKNAIKLLPHLHSHIRLIKESKLLENLNKSIVIDPCISEFLDISISEDPPIYIKDGGVIAYGFDKELDKLRDISDNNNNFIKTLEEKEKENIGVSNLRISYSKIFGFYIEITKSQLFKVPSNYRRLQTLKNTERFTIPELKQWEEQILSSKEKALAREKFLYETVLQYLINKIKEISLCAKSLSEIDVLLNLAEHSYIHKWISPIISEEPEIMIDQGKHPVVEVNTRIFTPNDCLLNNKKRMMIITGPNMGGKSTYMRQVALITLLARIGSFVPAKKAIIGKIDRIFTRIGASDDISGGKSTFMVEMIETATILSASTNKSLVLIDEIGRGTSTHDGMCLAWSIADRIINFNQSLTLFATHYFELTQIPHESINAINVHLAAIESNNDIIFLHEVKQGPANQSYGIQVARKAGIPISVIKEAKEKLNTIEKIHNKQKVKPCYAKNIEKRNDEIIETVCETIKSINVDSITPIEAINKLYEIKKIVGKLEK